MGVPFAAYTTLKQDAFLGFFGNFEKHLPGVRILSNRSQWDFYNFIFSFRTGAVTLRTILSVFS